MPVLLGVEGSGPELGLVRQGVRYLIVGCTLSAGATRLAQTIGL